MQDSAIRYHFEDISSVEKKLFVEVVPEYISKVLDEEYKKLNRSVIVPGFRIGKAPRSMLEQVYKKRVNAEVLERVVQESFAHIMENSESLRLIAAPALQTLPEVDASKVFAYEAKVETLPAVELNDYKDFTLVKSPTVVSEEMIDKAVEVKRQMYSEMVAIEDRDVLASTDDVVIELSGQLGQRALKNEKITVSLSKPDQSPLPGLVEALIGLPVTAKEQEISVEFPAQGVQEEFAGKRLSFIVNIVSAHERKLPVLDDEFAKTTGDAETLADLRQTLRERILKNEESKADKLLRQEAEKELLKRNPILLPPGFVQRVAHDYLKNNQRQVIMKALDNGKKAETIQHDDLIQIAVETVKEDLSVEFLTSELAKKENIEVTDADLEKHLAELAQRYNMSVPKLRAEFKEHDPEFSRLRAQLRGERALDWIVAHSKINLAV